MAIKLKGYNAASWVGTTVLAARQIGLELDTKKFKVGDGTTAWSSLPYWDASGSGSGGAWGSITGTLSSQTDLQTALDSKAPTTHIGATGAAHGIVSTSVNGFMSAADKTKLDGIASGATANTGTVTSVALSVPTGFSVTGSPITASGTLAITTALSGYVKGNGTGFTAAATVSTSDLTGTLAAAQFPALTGDVTTTGGALGTTIASGAVSLAKMANLAANSIIGNNTGSPATPIALTAAQVRTLINVADGATANTGTVTSVGGTGTVSGLTLTGTVTTSGNLTLGGTLAVTASNFASQTANTFLAAPNGAAGVPTFRSIVAADVPTLNQNTTGSAATLTTSRNFSITGGGITAAAVAFNGSAAVTLSASVDAGHITLARMANLAANSIIGNNTGAGATPLALTGTQVTAMLDNFSSTLKGLTPASGGGTTNFLRADGTWAAPPGGGGGSPGGSSGQLQFNNAGAFDGASGLNWDSTNGTLGVGRAAVANVRAYFRGGSTGSGAFSLYAENSTPTAVFGVRDDGAIFTGQTTSSPLNLTTTALPNLVVAADGYLYKSTATIPALTDGDKGDVTVSGSGATWTIDNSAVTYAKMQNVSATSRLLGRGSASTGSPEELTVAGLAAISGTVMSANDFTHFIPPGVTTGSFVCNYINAAALSTIAGAANRLEYYPFKPSKDITVDELAMEVTTLAAATNARVGIYDSTTAGIPNALLTGAGTLLDCSTTGVKTNTISPSLTLKAGVQYWLAIHSSGAPTYRGVALGSLTPLLSPATGTPNTCYRATATFASGLPTTASGLALNSGVGVWLRLRST